MLLFVLITAFLTMQWTAAHIHLAEHHDHDGSHHQHGIEAHSHQLAGHHSDTIDSPLQSDDLSVVELDHEYNPANGKKKTPATAAISSVPEQLSLFQSIDTELPVILNTKLSYLDRSTIYLRAPPCLS